MPKKAGESLWMITVITPDDDIRKGSIAIVPDKENSDSRFGVAVRVGGKTYRFEYEL